MVYAKGPSVASSWSGVSAPDATLAALPLRQIKSTSLPADFGERYAIERPGCGTHRSKVGDEMPATEAPFSGKTR